MAELRFRQKAIDDLTTIWQYTAAEWSESLADQYYSELRDCCNCVAKNPCIGKHYKEIGDQIRGIKSGKHIVFYRIENAECIEIIRVLHGRMDLKKRYHE